MRDKWKNDIGIISPDFRKNELTPFFPFFLCSMTVILTAVIGCDNSRRRGISGKVYVDPEIDHSIILSGDIEQSEYKAVKDATVYLTFDKEGLRPIEGSEVKTTPSGAYYINTSKLPPSTEPSGCYYLIVKKKGYDVFSHPVAVGTMSSYQRNRILLSGRSKK